ncbi:hypothetical protein Ocin01_10466 [Orchesella cincta]|uniref:F-box domain-containing protein n=1 Tax=Orchesella cincta TaxID=48709 RepID=A0A1D2MTU3_ORCCI|nr:hypothetical protein Ocin01_10466 [Orchesella cincta]
MDEEIRIRTAFSCYGIQRSVMRHLNVKDLKSLRLVDKHWMQSALFPLKETSIVTLNSPTSIQTYLQFLQDSGFSACFSNYKIVINPSKFDNAQEVIDSFSLFWTVCSSHVKELSIALPWTCTFPILEQIYQTSPESIQLVKLSLSLEKLESSSEKWPEPEPVVQEKAISSNPIHSIRSLISLNLNVSIVLTTEKKVFPFTWTDFFQKFPNICHLCIQSDYASGHFYRIVNILMDYQMGLKTLKIGTRDQRLFSEDFLKKLVLLTNNQTEVLSLGFLPSVRHESALDSMLSKSSASLTHLSFLQYRTANQATIIALTASDGNTFPNLTSLRITKELVPNLNFLCKMPKLKRLEIYRDSTIGQHDDLSNPVIRTRSLPVISTLQTLALEPFVPVEDVWKLVRWFPNLRRLQMKANDVIARIIFMKWKELKELYLVAEITRDNNDIVRSTLTDEGITGISRNVLLQQSGALCENVDPASHRTMPYIGNLTKLETCKLQVVADYLTGLTDHSVSFGLADLPNLTSLTLVKSLVSPEAAEMLRQHGVSVTIIKD